MCAFKAAQGMATGEVSFVVESPPERGEKAPRSTPLTLPISLEVIPTPPRWGPIPFIAGETPAGHFFTQGMLLVLACSSGLRCCIGRGVCLAGL